MTDQMPGGWLPEPGETGPGTRYRPALGSVDPELVGPEPADGEPVGPDPAGPEPAGGEPAAVVITADAELFDALAAGAVPPAGDEMVTLLADWRADLGTDLTGAAGFAGATGPASTPAAGTPVNGTAGPGLAGRATPSGPHTVPEPIGQRIPPDTRPPDGRPPDGRPRAPRGPSPAARRRPRRAWLAAAALVLVLVVLGAAAVTGTPQSPLWPLTRLLDPQRATVLQARQALDEGQQAILAARYTAARHDLDRAAVLIARFHDRGEAAALRARLDRLRAELAARRAANPAPGTTPTGPATATPGGSAGAGHTSGPGATTGPGGTSGGNQGGLPLPTGPLPPLPSGGLSPLPTLTLPPPPTLPAGGLTELPVR